ncbi:MAG: VCBS repeat-containing protein [Bdellovibrionales bacterium]|nr:VCBS repeat-containing protein [Bdellovibrionales bacterium]
MVGRSFPALKTIVFGLFLTFATRGVASFPSKPGEDPWLNRPNDPGYVNAWNLFSHIPFNHIGSVSEFERSIGSGVHADKAWQYHTGTPDTVIAVLDSGIFWDADDLLERFYLNRAELPKPEGKNTYDANGDGRFSVSDYAGDSRVSDKNGNGKIDPGDLIAVFSNGVDEDGNGYVDDISGWDFHEFDNDPADRTRFGHGTGEAHGSTAALNNGIGYSGICGNCSVIPLRLNDSFIVDANAFSKAVVYAADMRVSLIQQALGSVNSSQFTREAVEYAYAKGVPIIGSAADENSYHHNYPSTIDPIIYPNAIRYDSQNYEEASTFLNFNNCSNFGARVDVSVPGRACSSEATAILSGVSGLTLSYAKSLGHPLSPGELNALIKMAATDIALGPNDNDPFRYSTYAGWDTITGYGRANTANMFKAIRESKLPAEVRILSPDWFELFRFSKDKKIEIYAKIVARSQGVRVRVEVLKGVETSSTQSQVLYDGELAERSFTGKLAETTLEALKSLKTGGLDVERNRNAYTVRVTAVDRQGVRSEARKTFFAFEDKQLYASFPEKMSGSGESVGAFADLDGNGTDEFVTADGSGYLHAYTYPSGELKGFPVRGADSRYAAGRGASIAAPIAIGDLNGNGKLETVTVSLEGHLNAIASDGTELAGFPLALPFPDMSTVAPDQVLANGVMGAPVLLDLDGDGKLEIVVVAFDGLIHAYKADGSVQSGFPFALEHNGKRAKLLSSPAVYDVDKDGTPDLILGSNHVGDEAGFLWVVSGKGNLSNKGFPGFPARVPVIKDSVLPTIGVGIPTAPALADTDGDGEPEILIHPFLGKSYLFDLHGKIKMGLNMKVGEGQTSNDTHMVSGFGHPAFANLGTGNLMSPIGVGLGKRALTALALGGKRFDYQHMVGAWEPSKGNMLSGFPKILEDTALSPAPIAADLDGDGVSEIVVGSGGYFLHGFAKNGEAEGFPHFTGGWMYGTPNAGDFNGDGKVDIAVTTREGYVFIWPTRGNAKSLKNAWPTFKSDTRRTGTHLITNN